MTAQADSQAGPARFSRPRPKLEGPNRGFGGYYRSSDHKVAGKVFRGVPLQTAEDTAVAAVRMGYRVIDAQIDRALDMARRLRGAATRAGVKDSNDVLDQAERMLSRGGLLALEWLETAANRPENPLMRLLAAEYRLLGSVLGFPIDSDKTSEKETPKKSTDTQPSKPTSTAATAAPSWRVRIHHTQPEVEKRRAIAITKFEMTGAAVRRSAAYDVRFHPTSAASGALLKGLLRREANAGWVLEILTEDEPSGRWRAAVCTAQGDQVGIIEIRL
jgi:hypothetical protein